MSRLPTILAIVVCVLLLAWAIWGGLPLFAAAAIVFAAELWAARRVRAGDHYDDDEIEEPAT